MVYIAPSILSARFDKLGEEIIEVEAAGADWIHVDIMDGHFVPNLTFGPLVMEAIAPIAKKPLDVHLMVERPEDYIPAFAKAGAHVITVHQEACVHLHRVLHLIKEHGVLAGVALNPATPVSAIREVLEDVDMVLMMTVNPGFGGQAFIPGVLRKITELRKLQAEIGKKDLFIEVDGGISAQTAPLVVSAGADVLVAGSAVFGQNDRAAAIQAIRSSIEG